MIIILSIVIAFSLYIVLLNTYKLIHLTASSRTVKNLLYISKKDNENKDITYFLGKQIEKLSQYFSNIDKTEKKKEIVEKLKRTGIDITYEAYITKKITFPILAFFSLFFLGWICGIVVPFLGLAFKFLGVILAIMYYFDVDATLEKKIQQKKNKIILEMPRFVRTYRYTPSTKGFHFVVDDYLKTAKGGLKYDLEVLRTDINLHGEEQALKMFADRINILEVYEFVTVVVNSFSGDKSNTDTNLEFVEAKFIEKSSSILEKELNKRPEILDSINLVLVNCLLMLFAIPMLISTITGLKGML